MKLIYKTLFTISTVAIFNGFGAFDTLSITELAWASTSTAPSKEKTCTCAQTIYQGGESCVVCINDGRGAACSTVSSDPKTGILVNSLGTFENCGDFCDTLAEKAGLEGCGPVNTYSALGSR